MNGSCPKNNTRRVEGQHHMLTHSVFQFDLMKTVGERIRQARLFRGLSAEQLAKEVGYKTQSGISNLENRSTGKGGYMLEKIARRLDFSLEWFLCGPDTDDMSTVPPFKAREDVQRTTNTAREPRASYSSARIKCHQIIDELPEAGVEKALDMLALVRDAFRHSREDRAGYHVPARKEVA